MEPPEASRLWPHILGEAPARARLIATVVGMVILASGGFVIGLDVGLSLGWIVVALGIAFVAGVVRAGLLPTTGSLWLIGLWWFAFPPLVGYLSGEWTNASRYTHPRILGFAYTTARAELIGGIEHGVRSGFLFAVIGGSIAYVTGTVTPSVVTRLNAHR